MNDPGAFLCLAAGGFVIPIIALAVAIATKNRNDDLSRALERLTLEVSALRETLENQARGLRAAEKRLKELGEAPPAAADAAGAAPAPAPKTETPAVQAPPDVPTAVRPAAAVAAAAPRPAAKPATPAPAPFAAATPAAQPSAAVTPVPSFAAATPTAQPSAAAAPTVHSPTAPAAPPPAAQTTPPAAKSPVVAPAAVRPSLAPPASPAGGTPATPVAPPASPRPAATTAPAASAAAPRVTPAPPRVPPPPPPEVKAEPKGGWERRLGIVVPVWFGAIALTLGGGYLVKYSIEHSLISPQMRVVLAILVGLALLVTGEFLRKKTALTAQGASAAGVAVLYAALLAGTVLYDPPMIPHLLGFGLLSVVTAAAVFLSLRQGIVVAFVGLVGGFFTPYWIGAISASPGRLFTYMLLLQGGLLVVTRKRQWTGLSALTLLMGLGAALHRMAIPTGTQDAPFIGLFLLFSAGSFLWAARTWKDTSAVETGALGALPKGLLLGYLSLVSALLALAGLALRTRFGLTEWAFLGLLSLATLALGRLDDHYARLPWVAFVLTGTLLGGWVAASAPADRPSLWLVAGGFGLVWGLGGWACHHRSAYPATWATLSVMGGMGAFGAACAADYLHGKSFAHWGYLSAGVAVLYLLAAIPAALPARRKAYGEANLAAFCVAASAFLSFAVPLELERQWLSVAWAVEAAALAWLLSRLRVRALGAIGIALAAGVALRLLLNPAVLTYPVGTTPVWNWLLYGYGIPVLAFGLAAFWYERSGWARTGTALWWGSGALAFALLTLEVRQGFHPGSLIGPRPELLEVATYSHAWVALALLLLWAARRWRREVFEHLALALLGLSALKIVLLDLVAANPLWSPADLGPWPVFNWLLYVYGLSAAAFAWAARQLDRGGWTAPARACAWFSALAGFALLSLEVRQGFHPGALIGPRPTLVEWSTYSHLWLAAGLLLLAAAQHLRKPLLRDVAVAFAALAAAKILVCDLLLANPFWAASSLGTWPVLNWLLYAYGLPVALFVAVGWWVSEQDGGGTAGRAALWFAAAMGVFFLLFEVRQAFHPAGLVGPAPSLVEWATYSHLWMAAGLLLLLAYRRWSKSILWEVGTAFAGLSVVKVLVIDLVAVSPLWNHSDVGAWPLLNWLLYAYGLPVLALWALRGLCGDLPGEAEALAPLAHIVQLVLLWALVSLEVRQFFHPQYLDEGGFGLLESATLGHAWLFLAAGLLLAWRSRGFSADLHAARLLVGATAVKIVVVDLLARNPLGWPEDLGGTPILNGLLFVYALPMVLFWFLDQLTDHPAWRQVTRPLAAYGNLLLAIVLVTLQVRQFFHRNVLSEGPLTNAENYAYSAVWILFALGLLLAGINRQNKFLRVASLVFMLLAVVKVFLYDLRHLHDLYRVMSLMGLGASLLLISYLFSRFVLRDGEGEGARD